MPVGGEGDVTWVMHYRCGGPIWPWRKDGTCRTCGKIVLPAPRAAALLRTQENASGAGTRGSSAKSRMRPELTISGKPGSGGLRIAKGHAPMVTVIEQNTEKPCAPAFVPTTGITAASARPTGGPIARSAKSITAPIGQPIKTASTQPDGHWEWQRDETGIETPKWVGECKHLRTILPSAGASDRSFKTCKDCGEKLPCQELTASQEAVAWRARGK